MKGPREGSRKAEVYAVFHAEGLDAAIKKAKTLDLKEGTVKSWAGQWGGKPKADLAPDTRKGPRQRVAIPADQEAGTERPKEGAGEFLPFFKHASRNTAQRALLDIVRRSGTKEAAFHIIEQGGRFAVVPAHYKSGGPIPQFEAGDIVFDTIIPDQKGKVVKAGPEVCEVKGPNGVRNIPNYYLFKFAKEKEEKKAEKPVKAKRVRA